MKSITEKYGQLLLSQLFTHVWYGSWNEFEEIIQQLPEDLRSQFPFYEEYDREDTALWYENYFEIPGDYFIPPYLSSYRSKEINAENTMKEDLLQLITTFDQLGFYYPLEKDQFPDHIGSMTAFITATIVEEIKALQEEEEASVEKLEDIKQTIYLKYLKPTVERMWEENKHKISDPFFEDFIPYFISNIGFIANIKTSTGG